MESQSLALLREKSSGTLATIYSVEVLVMKIPSKIKWLQSIQLRERRCSTSHQGSHYCCSMLCLAMCQYDRDNEKKPTPEMAGNLS
jgi:hypothetical protein